MPVSCCWSRVLDVVDQRCAHSGGERVCRRIARLALTDLNAVITPIDVIKGISGKYGSGSNELYLVNNTIVDNRSTKGNILNAYAGLQRLLVQNNILVTNRTFATAAPGEFNNNPNAGLENFVQPAQYDFHLKSSSPLRNLSWLPLKVNGVNMAPKREYKHPAASVAIPKGTSRVVGAFQMPAP